MEQSVIRPFEVFEKHFCILTSTVLRALLWYEDIWVSYIWIFNVGGNRYGVGLIVPGVTVLQNGWWIVGPLVIENECRSLNK